MNKSENMKDKQLSVSAIKEGTVIDHVPASALFKVVSILKLDKLDTMITIGNNLGSKKLGKKGIIKLSRVFFRDDEINKIALVAPCAKLNIIRDYEVVEKKVVEIPDEIIGIAKCVNPKCITNNEAVTTRFTVVSKVEVKLKCHYCEKITNRDELQIT
jgi:aspartate carbamoyltransferase regulatory subunit